MLTDVRETSPGQIEMVQMLGLLVHRWEEEHEELIVTSPPEKVRSLLEADGLAQSALVPDVFPNRQSVSAFLNGRRGLTWPRACKLGAFFHLPPAAFFTPSR